MKNIGIYEWTVVLIGMGTTFIALILLWLILEWISFVFTKIRNRKVHAGLSQTQINTSLQPSTSSMSTGVSTDTVIAITAAIAASTGQNASQLKIGRISHHHYGISGLNTPLWGLANRPVVGSITIR